MSISASSQWKRPRRPPDLGERDVHLWKTSLDQPESIRSRLAQALEPQEQERATRFATDKLRHRFIVGRGILREILASYLDEAPRDLRFRQGEHGKPFLAGKWDGSSLQFNVSHSQNLAFFAVTRGRQIGVDLESIRDNLDPNEIASRFFSGRESARLRGLPAKEQLHHFFELWTCKEALVKAHGGGISFGLDRFTVIFDSSGRAIGIESREESFLPWIIYQLSPGPGFVGALAIEDGGLKVSFQPPEIDLNAC
jgi:4'-phosphopantetheinyl transferase